MFANTVEASEAAAPLGKELRQLRIERQDLLAGWQSDPAKDSNVIWSNLQV